MQIPFTKVTLPNGLDVIVHADRRTPIVAVSVWYHVGSGNEGPGQTGFAHLFEHLMFQGSTNVPPEAHASDITRAGGQSNAFTEEDVTVFWETLPSSDLPLALWLEADRMASLRITQAAFETERAVVDEERRERVDATPYGRLEELLDAVAFTRHPYAHVPLGPTSDLSHATLADLRAFYQRYYVPNNAAVAIAGDVSAPEAAELAAHYFGPVPKGRAVVRAIASEPAPAGERRQTVAAAWPMPAIGVAYHIPAASHPDAAPLQVLAAILCEGDTARLYRSIVYDKQQALALFGEAEALEDPSLFEVFAVVQPGHTPEQVRQELVAGIEDVAAAPVAAADLERAKRQLMRDAIVRRETIQGKALEAVRGLLLRGDASAADADLERVAGTTADDVLRVARTYLRRDDRVVLTVVPQMPATGGGGHAR